MRHDESKTDEEVTDEMLMRAYQHGDEAAFGILYARYSGRVYGYVSRKLSSRALADDAFQTVFLKLHRFRSRYQTTFPFAPWLFTICRNVVVDTVRAQRRIQEDSKTPQVEEVAAEEASPSPALPDFSALSPLNREAIRLRYGEDLSFEDIAGRMGTTSGNIRQRISRALRQLKQSLRSKEIKP